MNCPVPTEPFPDEGHNQNPPLLASELCTNNSLNHRVNQIHTGAAGSALDPASHDDIYHIERVESIARHEKAPQTANEGQVPQDFGAVSSSNTNGELRTGGPSAWAHKIAKVLRRYAKFIGPGFMVSVAYIDPGNYATDIQAGASFRFKLLFMVLLSNVFAIYLQALCVKLGTVTGLNLAENCKAHLPPWLNYVLYGFAEAAIIATDMAEVIGTAIALNLLLHIPLVAGCAISILDVLIILIFYNPSGMSMRALRIFEGFVMLLVLGVVVCFCFELSLIKDVSVGEIFKGYLPSHTLVQSKGLYQSCGILGATVMPHSLYLGSGIVQSRLKDFDMHNNSTNKPDVNRGAIDESTDYAPSIPGSTHEDQKWRPSLAAIKSCLTFSIVELSISLFFFAMFVNSAILIVAGASLSNLPPDEISSADLFGIHTLLSKTLAPAAGTMFALGLLLSGTSAGIICTMAGQMVSEGQLNLSIKPWMRRLLTRSISITPSIIVAGAVGREGLSNALVGSQVALSVILPFCSAPLIWFTCRSSIMNIWAEEEPSQGVRDCTLFQREDKSLVTGAGTANSINEMEQTLGTASRGRVVVFRNSWLTTSVALLIWLVIVIMNVALLVLLGLGEG